MGWFGISKDPIPCKVWKTRTEVLKGLSIEAMTALRDGNNAVVVTFFTSRRDECRSFFSQNGIPFTEDGASVFGVPAIHLLEAARANTWNPPATTGVVLLFHGLYPLPGREEVLLEKFSKAKAIVSCASLEDPLFKAFGMEKVTSLMETLGMKDGECVEHRFVDKAIQSAREKLAAKVKNEIKLDSEEEWFQRNISK